MKKSTSQVYGDINTVFHLCSKVRKLFHIFWPFLSSLEWRATSIIFIMAITGSLCIHLWVNMTILLHAHRDLAGTTADSTRQDRLLWFKYFCFRSCSFFLVYYNKTPKTIWFKIRGAYYGRTMKIKVKSQHH